jgi:hypothetical protein
MWVSFNHSHTMSSTNNAVDAGALWRDGAPQLESWRSNRRAPCGKARSLWMMGRGWRTAPWPSWYWQRPRLRCADHQRLVVGHGDCSGGDLCCRWGSRRLLRAGIAAGGRSSRILARKPNACLRNHHTMTLLALDNTEVWRHYQLTHWNASTVDAMAL